VSFQRKALKITFPEGHDLHGLEVYAKRARVEHIEAVQSISGETDDSVRDSVAPAVDMFAHALIGWNYVDETDTEVPATPEGFRSIDLEAQIHILHGWVRAASEISPDLGKESGSGHRSRAELSKGLPTVTSPTLSAALLSLPMHNEPSESSSGSAATP
jgi:hypothetical protein